ncbi:MAG: magnesium transporter, partial [Gammaproteobacteria bacterium]|nr:magnesium transporter [Gammaproteobacteria bacterium]
MKTDWSQAGSQERNQVDMARLVQALERRAPLDAAELLAHFDDATVVAAFEELPSSFAMKVAGHLEEEQSARITPLLPEERRRQWEINQQFEADTVGHLMEPAVGVFPETTSVAECRASLRKLLDETLFTYAYCTDAQGCLSGVVVMRDLLFADETAQLRDIMVPNPFVLLPDMKIRDAVHEVFSRHYPVYPVTNNDGELVGLVPGYTLVEEQADLLAATPGRMVGVQNEEHVTTPWLRAFRFRHPWLQVNLLTAFIAAAVVGVFEETIAQIVVLAAFLPVLAGQSGNTGCQAMAVTLRAMALDELGGSGKRKMLWKEMRLGLLNGLLVGVTAAIGMWFYASTDASLHAVHLGAVVLGAMTLSCMLSGMIGVLVPLFLKRMGADPATASAILLTTATDVFSMGMLLG